MKVLARPNRGNGSPDDEQRLRELRTSAFTLIAASLAALGLVAVFWPTATSIEAIWRRSQTFAHGYLVLPLVVWLIWRRRTRLGTRSLKPCWPALLVVAAAGFAWMVGRFAGVLSLEQFALYGMLVAAVVATLGLGMARELMFPLGFLVFAVPLGEFLVPTLIDRTADATVTALRLSGVPVYREGNQFMIPTGRWSVVEACSGVRYLIASVMVGTLYAHLCFRSWHRRLVFLLAAIAVPIVANWVRAYLIVIIGHLSSSRFAVGVDHLIYGWVFFGVVIAGLLWMGSFWREAPAASPHAVAYQAPSPTSRAPVLLAALLALILGGTWRPIAASLDALPRLATRDLPAIAGAAGWQPAAPPLPTWRPHFRGARSERQQWFTRDGQLIGVYLALYSRQVQGSELIASDNLLVSPGDAFWRQLGDGRETVRWNGADITARRLEIAGDGMRIAARAWYWVNGHHTPSDIMAKFWLALARLAGQPDHSALLVICLAQDEGSPVDATVLDQFTHDMDAVIMRTIWAATNDG